MPSGLIPERADIVDRNGVPLARTFDAWSIAVHPNKLIGDPVEIAGKLAALMPQKSAAQYLAILRSGKKFVYLDQRALPELVAKVNAIGEPGLAFGREPERLYPQGTLAAHVLGWIKEDGSASRGWSARSTPGSTIRRSAARPPRCRSTRVSRPRSRANSTAR